MTNLFAATGAPAAASYQVPAFMYVAILVALILYVILEVWHGRRDHVVGFGEAVKWSVFYISMAALFAVPVYFFIGSQAAGEYLAGWAVEKALSLDNLFVFGMIFAAFKVEQKFRRRILNYGIAGAIVFRFIFILLGFELLQRFAWVSIIFGLILLRAAFHAYKHARYGVESEEADMTKSTIWKLMNRFLPIHPKFDGHKLTTKVNGKRMLTMMSAIIILIELTDIVFAVDSVPAVLAVTSSQYIAYASNVFAILGLRSLFFVYDAVAAKFWALDWSLAIILAWIGVKMVGTPLGFHPPIWINLLILFGVLAAGLIVSLTAKNPRVAIEK